MVEGESVGVRPPVRHQPGPAGAADVGVELHDVLAEEGEVEHQRGEHHPGHTGKADRVRCRLSRCAGRD